MKLLRGGAKKATKVQKAVCDQKKAGNINYQNKTCVSRRRRSTVAHAQYKLLEEGHQESSTKLMVPDNINNNKN